MLIVEKIDESNRKRFIDAIRTDVVRHVFAFYDLQHDPSHTTVHAAFEDNKLKGYILVYTALEFLSVILECESDTVQKLLKHAPEDRFIMHAPPDLLPAIERKFSHAKHYVENWMLVKKGEARFFKSESARRLYTQDDASGLAVLLSTREDRPKTTAEKCMNLISNMPTYGVSLNDELVSYAGSFIWLPQVWMIGGVYTHPDHRNKGYATLATSAVTEEALKHAEAAALFVRSDNHPAVRTYEKIGYKKIGEKLWTDVGTGLKP
jgi:ribosomal protein S18 acetylase RimI-like enzyme